MSKSMQWIIGILAVLALGAGVTFLILWKKEYDKNAKIKKDAASTATAMRTKIGTKGVIAGEVCEWDGSNWVNCKPLKTTTGNA